MITIEIKSDKTLTDDQFYAVYASAADITRRAGLPVHVIARFMVDPPENTISGDSAAKKFDIDTVQYAVHSWPDLSAKPTVTESLTVDQLAAERLQKIVEIYAEQEELTRLRAEAAEREAKERAEAAERARIAAEEKAKADQVERERVAAENARTEAEAKAKAELEAAERREREAKEAQERAEREKVEAEQRAKAAAEKAESDRVDAQLKAERAQAAAVKAEQDRQAAEAKRIADEQAAREKDKKHKAAINNAAVDSLCDAGIDADTAKKVITLIAKKQVPNVQINY